MKISIIVEGKTETAFKPHLTKYLKQHLAGKMPKLDFTPYNCRIPSGEKLERVVKKLLSGNRASDHVIALTDVYTGTNEFTDANDAKRQMRTWVGKENRFHPHVAQYDFEAWLIPYWEDIQKLAGSNRTAPSGNPESVNHNNPPANLISEVFITGSKAKRYIKPRDAGRILRDNDLSVSIAQCSELKDFINTILTVCGAAPIT